MNEESRSLAILLPPDRPGELEAVLTRIRRGERLEQYETVRRTKDGQLVEVSLTIAPVFDALNRIVGVATIARDSPNSAPCRPPRRVGGP